MNVLHILYATDEYLTQLLFGKGEGDKIGGLQAAVVGAAAGLIAQAVTTPVSE